MGGSWGNNIKISIFGESHGKSIGVVVDGLPAGIKLDLDYINFEMQRRAPGKSKLTTSRKEKDAFEILSGFFYERTTGTPLCAVIWNENQKSKDYKDIKDLMRPGHGDYTGHIKYLGFNDFRGGGHFSGRLTAPLVFVGALAKQILKSKKNIIIGSHVYSIKNIQESKFNSNNLNEKLLKGLTESEFPVMNIDKKEQMKECILDARQEKDSVGGIIETGVINLPVGIGEPFFDSVESKIAHLLFSVPAVKGVEFGEGFDITKLKGSKANDEFYFYNDKVKTRTNNNGGILGGITNGMPIIFRTAIKPTPSISKVQNTININKKEETLLQIEGRHDPCIVPRVIPVIESVAAIAILDLIIEGEGVKWMS